MICVRIDFKFSKPKVLLNLKNDKTFQCGPNGWNFQVSSSAQKDSFLNFDLEAMIQKKNRVPPCVAKRTLLQKSNAILW